MSRLDRYIFKATLLPFLLILACTTAVAWLTQVLQRMDIIVDDGGTLTAFLKITLLLIPSLVGVVMPIALLAAVIYTLNALMVDSEIPVMRAAGASRFRIARPLLLLGGLTAVAVYGINLDLAPRSYRQLRDTVYDVRSNLASGLVRDGVFVEVAPGLTFYAEDVRPGDQYVGVHIHDSRDERYEITSTAENGLFMITEFGPQLLLLRGTGQQYDRETGQIDIVRFQETAFDLAEFDTDEPVNRPYQAAERFLPELFNPDLERPYNRQYQGRFRAEGHARLATPLYCFAFVLIAAVYLLGATTSRRGYGKLILYASATAGGVRIAGFLTQSMAAETAWIDILQYAIPGAAIVACSIHLLNTARLSPPKRARVLEEAPA